jgi:hypothetical protein
MDEFRLGKGERPIVVNQQMAIRGSYEHGARFEPIPFFGLFHHQFCASGENFCHQAPVPWIKMLDDNDCCAEVIRE